MKATSLLLTAAALSLACSSSPPDVPPPSMPVPGAVADETLCGDVQLGATKTVPAGKALAICAGSTVTASTGVTLTVQGKLLVQGTAQKPVKLGGAQGWGGLVIEA